MPSFQSIGAGLLAVLLFACQSPAGSSPAAQLPPAVPVPTVPTHPYFAGAVIHGTELPGYWGANGVWTALDLPSGTTTGKADCIVASGNDVYVGGVCSTSAQNGSSPGYWLNGTWTALPVPSPQTGGNVAAIVIDGTNVYAAGYCNVDTGASISGYWLNGTWTPLSGPPNFLNGDVSSIVVSGGSVYFGGRCTDFAASSTKVGYWKDNDLFVEFAPPSGGEARQITGLVVNGTTVSAGGLSYSSQTTPNSTPGYWVGAVWNALTAPGTGPYLNITGMAVSGGVTYVSAFAGTYQGYWADASWQGLNGPTGTYGSVVLNSLLVVGSDVYAAGACTINETEYPGYWLNGIWKSLNLPTGVNTGVIFGSCP